MTTVTFMAGAAGSGKGYIRSNDAALMELPVVDADAFKQAHPDYDAKNPSALHTWSSEQAMRAFFGKLAEGSDFIYDGTGTSAAKYIQMMRQARSAGFQVEVVFVKVSLATSLRRNAERERNVPEAIVREQHDLLPTSIDLISEEADSMRVVRND